MLEIQEAIDILDKANRQGGTYGFVQQFEEATKLAYSALEKQIPKKPLICTAEGQYRETKLEILQCPNCHKYVSKGKNHCSNCGQKLDWSDT